MSCQIASSLLGWRSGMFFQRRLPIKIISFMERLIHKASLKDSLGTITFRVSAPSQVCKMIFFICHPKSILSQTVYLIWRQPSLRPPQSFFKLTFRSKGSLDVLRRYLSFKVMTLPLLTNKSKIIDIIFQHQRGWGEFNTVHFTGNTNNTHLKRPKRGSA